MKENHTIYLLIGPKGSGKSTIGAIMEKEFGIKFLRVEDWVKDMKQERDIKDEAYLEQVFQTIESGVRSAANTYPKIVFESTGLTNYFDKMLDSIQQDLDVTTIGIHASPDKCLQRVKSRDQSIHINISDERVEQINRDVVEKNLDTDFVLYNDSESTEALMSTLIRIIDNS